MLTASSSTCTKGSGPREQLVQLLRLGTHPQGCPAHSPHPRAPEILDLAAVVHHSASEGKTGLISTPSQSRSALSPARSILPVGELAADFTSGTGFASAFCFPQRFSSTSNSRG